MAGTLEVDLTLFREVKTMDKRLNLKTSETQATENPSLPSGFRVQNGTKIAVHFSIAPKEKEEAEENILRCGRKPWPKEARPGRQAGGTAPVGDIELWIRMTSDGS